MSGSEPSNAAANAPASLAPAFSVVTFNIRNSGSDDRSNAWPLRAGIFVDFLRELAPDVLATQEALSDQIGVLTAALPGYQRIGVGRIDGRDAGEWSAIFVRKSRFEVKAEGNFWLSETPTIPGSRSWDAPHHTRLCTWAHIEDKSAGGKSLCIYNSHWDNEGVVARANSAALIAGLVAQRPNGVPAIVTGDFNCTPDASPIRYLTSGDVLERATVAVPDSPMLADSWAGVHANEDLPSGTFHGFHGNADGDRIDYILVSKGVETVSCEIVRAMREGRFPSDHFPVKALLRI